MSVTPNPVRQVVDALLARRAAESSLCPSEVARALAAGDDVPITDWREAMPIVHAAIDSMVAEGAVRLSWKGQPLALRAGPYRITRA